MAQVGAPPPATALVELPNKATVTVADVLQDARRLRPEARDATLSNPATVAQGAQNLMVRRMLAAEARAQGLDKDPLVAAAIQQALDRALSEAYLAELDRRNEPSAQALEQFARAKYNAEPQRFQAPAESRARHILVRETTPTSKAKAEELLEKLKSGADFESLAKAESQDPGSAARGGDLGWFGAGRMVKPFEDAVAALSKPGELSGLVETQFGYHIIQLVDRREAGLRPFDEVRDTLMREARSSVLSDGRVRAAQSIVEQLRFNEDAIKALADSFRKP